MQENLLEWLRANPEEHISRLWLDYLPNDPYCQQAEKLGRSKILSRITRCDLCRQHPNLGHGSIYHTGEETYYVKHLHGTKLQCKVYGQIDGRLLSRLDYQACCPESLNSKIYIGVDRATNIVIGMSILECIIPQHVNALEKIFRCQDRVTIMQPIINKGSVDGGSLYQQAKTIVAQLHKHRFSLGNINHHTVKITDQGLCIHDLQDASYDLNEQYRIGPMLTCHDFNDIHVFKLKTYPDMQVKHYFRLHDMNNKKVKSLLCSGIPIVSRSLDLYRLVMYIAVYSGCDITQECWFKQLFLTTELPRVIKRIKIMKDYISKHKQHPDMLYCLFDKQGCFSLQCDVVSHKTCI